MGAFKLCSSKQHIRKSSVLNLFLRRQLPFNSLNSELKPKPKTLIQKSYVKIHELRQKSESFSQIMYS